MHWLLFLIFSSLQIWGDSSPQQDEIVKINEIAEVGVTRETVAELSGGETKESGFEAIGRRFSLRMRVGVELARFAVYPKALPDESVHTWSPGLSANVTAGALTGGQKQLYFAGRAFYGRTYGASDAKWFFDPRSYFGGGFVTGVVVEEAFLTTVALGVMRYSWDIGEQKNDLVNEKYTMAFVQLGSESMLSKLFSVEVMYRYAKALSSNDRNGHFAYRARPAAHTFSIGIVIRL